MPTFQFWVGVVSSTCTTPINARRMERLGLMEDQMLKRTIDARCFCDANIEFNKYRGLEPYQPPEDGCDFPDCIMEEECSNCRWWEQFQRSRDDGKCANHEADQHETASRYDWCHGFERKELT